MDATDAETITTPDGEVARRVPGWSDYFVDQLGAVWSTKWGKLRRMKLTRRRLGYRHVALSDGERKKSYPVHTLVLLAWIGPRPEGMECRHLDGNPGNNRLSNLQWGTHLENEMDKRRHGTVESKLTEDQVREIIADADSPHTELAERYGVTPGMIMRIRQGIKWRHVERDEDAPRYQSGRCALTEDDVRQIRYRTEGMPLSEIASRFGTTKSNVSRIKRGITWAHVGE